MASDAKKILLVEDEKAIRDAVAAYLEREGYWVVGVGDGQSAIEEFEKHQFDLVVLDLMLPKIPGERVCRTIRDTSDVPIIMLTAKGEIEDRIIGLELGADDYLIKPFSPRELVARVRALFRRAHQADEPAVEVPERIADDEVADERVEERSEEASSGDGDGDEGAGEAEDSSDDSAPRMPMLDDGLDEESKRRKKADEDTTGMLLAIKRKERASEENPWSAPRDRQGAAAGRLLRRPARRDGRLGAF